MPKPRLNATATLWSCYIGYITQAIINNLAPLLFVTFYDKFGLTLSEISVLITLNFSVQMLLDLLSAKLVDKIGYRAAVITANGFATAGLLLLGVLPGRMSSTFAALCIAYILSAVGGGLIEVTISPIVESIPGGHKASRMSLLHSFYCWGQMAVVALSTLYFVLFGRDNWQYLPLIWAILPLFNAVFTCFVPFYQLVEEGKGLKLRRLLASPAFWLMMLLMCMAGASELALSQWSSLFAEMGLKVDKTLGDLLGPCAFALLMGLARVAFSVFGKKISLPKLLFLCSLLCIGSYLLAALSPLPVLSLVGCALTGLAVGMMWPGTISLAGKYLPRGGTAMFAMLALAGDIGCTVGPALVGRIADSAPDLAARLSPDPTVAGLKLGILIAVVFPLLMAVGTAIFLAIRKKGFEKLHLDATV